MGWPAPGGFTLSGECLDDGRLAPQRSLRAKPSCFCAFPTNSTKDLSGCVVGGKSAVALSRVSVRDASAAARSRSVPVIVKQVPYFDESYLDLAADVCPACAAPGLFPLTANSRCAAHGGAHRSCMGRRHGAIPHTRRPGGGLLRGPAGPLGGRRAGAHALAGATCGNAGRHVA
jgi:hypothetical protein